MRFTCVRRHLYCASNRFIKLFRDILSNHIIHYTPLIARTDHTHINTNLELGATINSYSVVEV